MAKFSLTCRVQYLNDVDPFSYASSYPEPPRPPVHTFSATLPLINQLAAVHRLLRAPHRVSSLYYTHTLHIFMKLRFILAYLLFSIIKCLTSVNNYKELAIHRDFFPSTIAMLMDRTRIFTKLAIGDR